MACRRAGSKWSRPKETYGGRELSEKLAWTGKRWCVPETRKVSRLLRARCGVVLDRLCKKCKPTTVDDSGVVVRLSRHDATAIQ